jgi:hypothetical protein
MMSRKHYNLVMIFLLVLFLFSCAPWRVQYLRGVVDKATQDEITKRLGPPHSTRELASGEIVWSYQYIRIRAVVNTVVCKEYILTFDQDRILREWIRQKC